MNLAKFVLAKTSLIRLGCPREVESLTANRALGRPIIAVLNRNKYGKTATDYFPPVVVVCGDETRRGLLAQGYTKSWAMIERGGIDIDSEEEMPYAELMSRLSGSLQDKYYNGYPGQARPGVTQIYPFENRVAFRIRDTDYSQNYALVAGSRDPVLLAAAIPLSPVANRFVMPNPARTELVTHILAVTPNVEALANQYVALCKNGGAIKPNFSPVAATYDKKINAMLEAKGIDAFEFALWVAAKERGDFAFPKEKKLPLNTPGRVRNALSRVNQTQGIPENERPGVLQRIRRKAKKIGVDVSEPTTGQKQWAKKKVKATVQQTSYTRQGAPGSGPGYPTGQMAQAIKAGGPGSGRHPGEGIHEHLVNNGYKHEGRHVSYHGTLLPRKGVVDRYSKSLGDSQQTIEVHKPTGQWSTHDWRGGTYKNSSSGVGLGSLQEHLHPQGMRKSFNPPITGFSRAKGLL